MRNLRLKKEYPAPKLSTQGTLGMFMGWMRTEPTERLWYMTVRQFRMDQILKEIRKERLYQCFVTWLTGCELGGLGKLGAFCHVLYKYCFPIFMFVFVLQKFQIIM